jgi:hypothetical protein
MNEEPLSTLDARRSTLDARRSTLDASHLLRQRLARDRTEREQRLNACLTVRALRLLTPDGKATR